MNIQNKVALLFLALLCPTHTWAQTEWTKYAENPVMTANTTWWDVGGRSDPSVILDGTTYKMWFATSGGDHSRIAYATSLDGINWTDIGPVLDRGDSSAWDGGSVDAPHVSYDEEDGVFKMWYSALETDSSFSFQIGYATSADGMSWVKFSGNPVLRVSEGEASVSDPVIVKVGNQYTMWYSVAGFTDIHISAATSTDGINWTKQGMVLQGGMNAWDSLVVAQPAVLFNGANYEMWYSGGFVNPIGGGQIGYAISEDALIWTKFPNNPVVRKGVSPDFDWMAACCATVLRTDSLYKMWYTGAGGEPLLFRIGYATSPLVTSIREGDNGILTGFELSQNYPNPFNPETTIEYQLADAGNVTLRIYNLVGQEVRTLVNEDQTAGSYSIVWDGKNDAGELATSGVYFYKLKVGESFLATRKMLFLK